jgi:hypothetical protein
MLLISAKQIEVFREAAMRRFENEMLKHLTEFSPLLFKSIGEEQAHKVIQFGIEQARNYGFTFRGPVRLYLELMVLFGSYFDTDPQYAWATEILKNQDADSQMQRAEHLYDKVMDYRQKVTGLDDRYTFSAYRNIIFLLKQPSLSPDNFLLDMLIEIDRCYPQKAGFMGRNALEALIRKGLGGAQNQQFTTVHGVVLVVVLLLVFGNGCGADPMYPWILDTFKDETLVDPLAREKRLQEKTLNWLEFALANSEQGITA